MRKSRILNILSVAILSVALLSSCATKKIVDEKIVVKTDTVYKNTIQKDSVYSRDSIFTFVKGDTLIIKEYHLSYIDKLKVDTVYVSKADSTYYNHSEVVQKKQSFFSRFRDAIFGGIILLIVIIGLIYIFVNIRI